MIKKIKEFLKKCWKWFLLLIPVVTGLIFNGVKKKQISNNMSENESVSNEASEVISDNKKTIKELDKDIERNKRVIDSLKSETYDDSKAKAQIKKNNDVLEKYK